MAFEDDMIEAGYSDEQEYLDSLIDDFEASYTRQLERESQYSDDYDEDYDEEAERERREARQKREAEKQWVRDWKDKNLERALIWQWFFSTRSYYADISHADDRHFMGDDVDYIKQHFCENKDIQILKKELRDKLIWKVLFKNGYKDHYSIDSMYLASGKN